VKNSRINQCELIQLPKIINLEGNLTSVNNTIEIPFEIERIYYLFDVPSGESRGGHGHKYLEQIIIAVSGSFTVTIDDGKRKQSFLLNKPNIGLYMKPGIWRDLSDFSSGATCLVLASDPYDEADYIRDYKEFLNYKLKT
jgi:hypothetical protein